jgi:hypothetical protein
MYANSGPDLFVLQLNNNLDVKALNYINNALNYFYFSEMTFKDSSKIITSFNYKDTVIKGDLKDAPYYVRGSNGNIFMEDFMFKNVNTSSNGIITNSGSGGTSTAGSMAAIITVGNYMYLLKSSYQLVSYNISDKINPTLINTLNNFGQVETIYPFNNKLFIGGQAGMYIYDINTDGSLSKLGQFNHANACDPVVTDGKYAYVTLRNGTPCNSYSNQMDIVDVTDLKNPFLVYTLKLKNPFGLCKKDNYVMVCDNNDGVKVINVSDASNPKVEKTINLNNTRDLFIVNNIAYIGTTEGLYLYDVSDMNNINQLSKVK